MPGVEKQQVKSLKSGSLKEMDLRLFTLEPKELLGLKRLSITENSRNEKTLLVLFPLLRYLWYWVFGDLKVLQSDRLSWLRWSNFSGLSIFELITHDKVNFF